MEGGLFAGAVRGYVACAALYFSLSSFRSLRLFRHTARGGLRQLCCSSRASLNLSCACVLRTWRRGALMAHCRCSDEDVEEYGGVL